jgi:hypothetical protein
MPGLGPGSGGPFYFAWAQSTDTVFGSGFYSYDENIFDFSRDLIEGQIPTLSITIKNPGVGLLNPGRKQWCWFSWFNGIEVVPLFFGRLVGIPSGLADQVIQLHFIARANDYVARKQALAETLKVDPFYDPAFLDDSHRNDPDAILEAYAAAFHVDPVSLEWTISDILQGEDGTVVFSTADGFYDSLKCDIGQPCLTSLVVNATVKWSQIVTGGSVFVGTWNFQTLTGASFIDDWPKAGARIGGGWVVQLADAVDMYGVNSTQSVTYSSKYINMEKTHIIGDIMSAEASITAPVSAAPMSKILLTQSQTIGYITDEESQPTSTSQATFLYVPTWLVSSYLYLEYEADRKRTEQLSFMLTADLQPVLSDPTVQQDSEVMDISSVDLGVPLILSNNWTVLAGHAIALGQVCYPNNPVIAGQVSYQICVVAGTAGFVEPDFSNVIGAPTIDGSVTWACLGPSIPAIPDWNPSVLVSLGTLIAPIYPAWTYYSALLPPMYPMRRSGAQISVGQLVRADNNSSFQMAILGGTTGYFGTPSFSPFYGGITVDNEVEWFSLGPVLPSGTIQMAVQQGQTGLQVPPPFSAAPGVEVADGGVIWVSLGFGGPSCSIPVGGVVGNVTARSYFPSDRGQRSIEYLLMKARAKLLTRARAVEVSIESPFAKTAPLTCRMSASIIEAPVAPNPLRLPGGQATGKIIKTTLKGDGATGKFGGEVTIGCAVGNGGTPPVITGTSAYGAPGYGVPGYSSIIGQTSVPDTGDIGYSKPLDSPNDDGLIFPLDAGQVVLDASLSGDLASQLAAIAAAEQVISVGDGSGGLEASSAQLLTVSQLIDQACAAAGSSIYLDLLLKPVTGQQFTTAYALDVTPLSVVKLIDLSA